MALFPEHRKWQDEEHHWIKQHSLGVTLAVLLAVQTVYAIFVGHWAWIQDGKDHGEKLTGWPGEFWLWWSWEYNISLVADTFGVLLIVLLSKWLYEQGSAE